MLVALVSLGLLVGVPHPPFNDPADRLLPSVQRQVDRLAGQHVRVVCKNFGDHLTSDGFPSSGYSLGPTVDVMFVQAGFCAEANRMTVPAARAEMVGRLRYYRDMAAEAILTLAHEAIHTQLGLVDWRNEGQVQCVALAQVDSFARGLGASRALAADLARRARVLSTWIVRSHPEYACGGVDGLHSS